MAVASGPAALRALEMLLGSTPVRAGSLLHGSGPLADDSGYLPPDLTVSSDHTLTSPDTMIGGYGSEARYVLDADPRRARLLAQSAHEVLSSRADVVTSDVRAYVKTSLDLTMQGGTTSGVVYPLAVCELAGQFRFRNVGGASAGAIAAALTAAAELGRSSAVTSATADLTPAPDLASTPARPTAPGHVADPHGSTAGTTSQPPVRRGFVGLTDIIGWLTQTLPGDSTRDEFRLAQMFRPGAANRGIFRVAIAAMRQRTWSLPLLALLAFNWATRIVAGVLIVGTVFLTGWLDGLFRGVHRSAGGAVGWGLIDSATFVASIVGVALLLPLISWFLQRRMRKRAADLRRREDPTGALSRLGQVTSSYAGQPVTWVQRVVPAVLLIGVVVAFAVSHPASYAAALVVGLAGSFVVLITLVISLSGYVGRLRSSSFGLLAGTATAPSRRNILDLMAGVPASTAPRSVIPWLNDCLSQLAGLPEGEVLRFGHLWLGTAFSPLRLRPSEKPPQEVQHLGDPDYRLVNLELMTTDLTRQRPYRFPLPCRTEARPTEPGHAEDYDQLWVCLEQLTDGDCQMFPDEVLAVLAEGESRNVRDRSGTDRTLHRLPDPWDLPVIFAVRLSMALPALFQAVRMYRMVEPAPVHDDFGRAIAGEDGTELMFPRPSAPLAEEVWFSDGGITSNFPVHFFDASLPRWPTVSLNLGRHPDSAPQQDVSLPQDWDPDNIPEQPLSDSGLSLASGVFNTAMSWRDNLQSSMPGYRNRIAQVRTRSNEGGTNLFMPREVVASMALRGALAGARLRTRFHDDSQWDRFRWLRLRVAVSNVERLRQSVQERQIFYADALSGPKWVDHQRDTFCDQPRKATIDWYKPDDSYWPAAAELLSTFAAAYQQPSDRNGPDDADSPDDANDPDVLTAGVATPMPVLRQVPRE